MASTSKHKAFPRHVFEHVSFFIFVFPSEMAGVLKTCQIMYGNHISYSCRHSGKISNSNHKSKPNTFHNSLTVEPGSVQNGDSTQQQQHNKTPTNHETHRTCVPMSWCLRVFVTTCVCMLSHSQVTASSPRDSVRSPITDPGDPE